MNLAEEYKHVAFKHLDMLIEEYGKAIDSGYSTRHIHICLEDFKALKTQMEKDFMAAEITALKEQVTK
jgi:hypothetical protein